MNNPKKYPVSLKHVDSVNFKGLQVVDLISWAVFQNFEKNNDEFSKLIKNKNLKRVFEDEKNLQPPNWPIFWKVAVRHDKDM